MEGVRCASYAASSSVAADWWSERALLDPHRVSFVEFRRLTEAVGLYHERTLKDTLGYFAVFRAS
jgi:hypothetical protein